MNDNDLIAMIERVLQPALTTDEEDERLTSILHKEVPGIIDIMYSTGGRLTAREMLDKARHSRRVIAVGPQGAEVTPAT